MRVFINGYVEINRLDLGKKIHKLKEFPTSEKKTNQTKIFFYFEQIIIKRGG